MPGRQNACFSAVFEQNLTSTYCQLRNTLQWIERSLTRYSGKVRRSILRFDQRGASRLTDGSSNLPRRLFCAMSLVIRVLDSTPPFLAVRIKCYAFCSRSLFPTETFASKYSHLRVASLHQFTFYLTPVFPMAKRNAPSGDSSEAKKKLKEGKEVAGKGKKPSGNDGNSVDGDRG